MIAEAGHTFDEQFEERNRREPEHILILPLIEVLRLKACFRVPPELQHNGLAQNIQGFLKFLPALKIVGALLLRHSSLLDLLDEGLQ